MFSIPRQAYQSEILQFKPSLDQLNRLSRDLCDNYQGDDTDRVRRITDGINQRYESLLGGAPHPMTMTSGLTSDSPASVRSAMSSSAKFLSWVAEMDAA